MSLRYNRLNQRGASSTGSALSAALQALDALLTAGLNVGDLLGGVAGGGLAALPIGTPGQRLTPDPASPTGFSWVDPVNPVYQHQTRPDADIGTAPTAPAGTLTVESTHPDGTIVVWTRPDDVTPFTVSSTTLAGDGNPDLYPVIVRADMVRDVAPTAAEAPSPKAGDMAPVKLSDGTTQYFVHDGTNWVTPAQLTIEPDSDSEIDTVGPFTGAAPAGTKLGVDPGTGRVYTVDASGDYQPVAAPVGSETIARTVANVNTAPVNGDLTNTDTLYVISVDDANDVTTYWTRPNNTAAFTLIGSTMGGDGNPDFYPPVERTNATRGVAPAPIEAPDPKADDVVPVFLNDGTVEHWKYDGTAWALDETLEPPLTANQHYQVARTTTAQNVPPTAAEAPNPKQGATAFVVLSDGTKEWYNHDGSTWGAPIYTEGPNVPSIEEVLYRANADIAVPPVNADLANPNTTLRVVSVTDPEDTVVYWERATAPGGAFTIVAATDDQVGPTYYDIEYADGDPQNVLPTVAETEAVVISDSIARKTFLPSGRIELYRYTGLVWALDYAYDPAPAASAWLPITSATTALARGDYSIGKVADLPDGTVSLPVNLAVGEHLIIHDPRGRSPDVVIDFTGMTGTLEVRDPATDTVTTVNLPADTAGFAAKFGMMKIARETATEYVAWVDVEGSGGTGGSVPFASPAQAIAGTATGVAVDPAALQAAIDASDDKVREITLPLPAPDDTAFEFVNTPSEAELQALVDSEGWTAESFVVITPSTVEYNFLNRADAVTGVKSVRLQSSDGNGYLVKTPILPISLQIDPQTVAPFDFATSVGPVFHFAEDRGLMVVEDVGGTGVHQWVSAPQDVAYRAQAAAAASSEESRIVITTPDAGIANDDFATTAEIQALVDANGWTAGEIEVHHPWGEVRYTNKVEGGVRVVRRVPRYPELLYPVDDLQAGINAMQDTEQNILELSHGEHTISANLLMQAPSSTNSFDTAGFTLQGHGRTSYISYLTVRPKTGTRLELEPGVNIDVGTGFGIKFKKMTIAGTVEDGPMIDFNRNAAIQGGIEECLIINQIESAPAGNPIVLEVDALFTSVVSDVNIYGAYGFRQRESSYVDVVASNDLYWGTGLRVNTVGVGSGNNWQSVTVAGCDIGVDIGYTEAEWALLPAEEQVYFQSLEFNNDFQANFCNTGVDYKKGVGSLQLNYFHLEENMDKCIHAHSGCGDLHLNHGNITGSSRFKNASEIAAEKDIIKTAFIVVGDSDPAESEHGRVFVDGTGFGFIEQVGLLAYGSPENNPIEMTNCSGRYNGGVLVAINDTNGLPNIRIKGWRTSVEQAANDFPVDRLVAEVAYGVDYDQITSLGDRRHLVRIEDSGPYGEDIIAPNTFNAMDFGTRMFPPVACRLGTLSSNFVITLGNAVPIGMETTLRKHHTLNSLRVLVPENMEMIASDGTIYTGAAITGTEYYIGSAGPNTAVGYYTFERIYTDVWTVSTNTVVAV